jgi:hypothetical protein
MANSSQEVPDFFSNLADMKPTTYVFITFAILASIINPIFLYFAIWYEKYGSDNKRTVINKFASSLFWCAIQFHLLILPADIFRFLYGPLPKSVCLTFRILKMTNFLQVFVFFDLIVLSRYVYIFVLKNSAGFNDEFWAFFLNIWSTVMCLLTKAAYHLAIPQQAIAYYFCCGIDPKFDNNVNPR